MDKSLAKLARKKFKVNPSAFICLGVFFCIFAAICVALSLLVPFLGMIAMVLLAIPLLFGIVMQTSAIDYFEKVEFKNIVIFSTRYFHPQFSGSLRLLLSFLKSMLVELISYILILIVTGLIARGMHPAEFDEAFSQLTAFILTSSVDSEQFNAIMNMHNGLLAHINNIAICGSALVFYLTFIFHLFYNTLGVYFRTLLKPQSLMFGRSCVNTALKENRRNIFKDFMYLNWPMLVLGLIGALLGGYLSIVISKDYIYLQEFGLIGCLLFIALYFPMYLANMNALFDKYKFSIVLGVNSSIKKTIEKIQRSVDLSEDDRKAIEDTLQEFDEDIKEMEERDKENKKDSNE